MCAYKDNSDVDNVKKREYLKQQHQLRTMTKTNNALSADDMIENLLSKKEIFKMKKEPNPPQSITTQANYPAWLYPGHEPPLYKRVWDLVNTSSGFADTPKLTNLLLTSRLPTDVLGYIWSLSNISLAPALSQLETYASLALVALVQSGYSFTSVAVLNTLKEAPIPKLECPLLEGPVIMSGLGMVPPSPTSIVPSVYSVSQTSVFGFNPHHLQATNQASPLTIPQAPIFTTNQSGAFGTNQLSTANQTSVLNTNQSTVLSANQLPKFSTNQVPLLASNQSAVLATNLIPVIDTNPVPPLLPTTQVFNEHCMGKLSIKPSEIPQLPLLESQTNSSVPSVQTVTNEFTLLDLEISMPSAKLKSELPKSLPASSILDKENSIDFSEEIPVADFSSKKKEQDLISEFSPTSCKNKDTKLFNSSFSTVSQQPFTQTISDSKQEVSLVDDLFGDFQSVSIPEPPKKAEINDEIEFDDFKSADFTPFNILEVKEKPPETIVEPPVVIELSKIEKPDEKSGIEDLFPKCVVKTKDDNFDLLAGDEDRYSALRGLTASDDHDEFGDFLTAAPTQPTMLPPPFTNSQANIQERAMEACLDLLEEATKIFDSIDEEEVLNEVISDPRGIQYLEELIEVERIALRLRTHLDKEDLNKKLDHLSKALEKFLKPHRHSFMAEETGPKCGICLCEKGPAYVKYGINNFHAPCANLYLHKVDSILPIAPVM